MVETKQRFMLPVAVYVFFIKDDEILLLRRFQTGYQDGNYSVVSGHIDGNETLTQAMVREISEEAGVKVSNDELEFSSVMHRSSLTSDHERIDIFFKINNWSGEIKNAEPDKCDDLSWFKLNQLPENIIPYIKTAIDCHLKGIKYCEFGWEQK